MPKTPKRRTSKNDATAASLAGNSTPANRIKPDKPRDCPLTPHPCGQWVAKIDGKVRYFGRWADLPSALEKYHATKLAIAGGQTVAGVIDPHAGEGATVADCCNLFLASKEAKVEAGELTRRSFDEYRKECKFFTDIVGRSRRAATLTPADFAAVRKAAAERVGPVALTNILQRIRSVFIYAYENGTIDKPMRFGPDFKRPPAKLLRASRNEAGEKLYTAAQIRSLLDGAKPQLRAMILLGINAGFGATDIAELPTGAVDLTSGWISFPRPKTAMPRRVPLWPETIAALKAVATKRVDPHDEAHAGLCFITQKTRQPYVRFTAKGGKVDGVAVEFRKLTTELGYPGRFYDLRRTHRTVSDEAGDQIAAGVIMGHVPCAQDMAAVYRQRVSDARLQAVANYVRAWLFAKPSEPAAASPSTTQQSAADPLAGWTFTTTTDLAGFSLDDLQS